MIYTLLIYNLCELIKVKYFRAYQHVKYHSPENWTSRK